MENLFNSIYYYTSCFYSQELDNYLYETIPGYLHVGLIAIAISLIVAVFFYYIIKPVRFQWAKWWGCVAANAILNVLVALYYAWTPLINNQIDESEQWTGLDIFGFCISNVLWSTIFIFFIALLIKWWSPAKYIPFKKF